jgi:hypothetical protein
MVASGGGGASPAPGSVRLGLAPSALERASSEASSCSGAEGLLVEPDPGEPDAGLPAAPDDPLDPESDIRSGPAGAGGGPWADPDRVKLTLTSVRQLPHARPDAADGTCRSRAPGTRTGRTRRREARPASPRTRGAAGVAADGPDPGRPVDDPGRSYVRVLSGAHTVLRRRVKLASRSRRAAAFSPSTRTAPHTP